MASAEPDCSGPSRAVVHRYVLSNYNGLDTEWIEDNGERLLYGVALRGHMEPDTVSLIFKISEEEAQQLIAFDKLHADLNAFLVEMCADGRPTLIRHSMYSGLGAATALSMDWHSW